MGLYRNLQKLQCRIQIFFAQLIFLVVAVLIVTAVWNNIKNFEAETLGKARSSIGDDLVNQQLFQLFSPQEDFLSKLQRLDQMNPLLHKYVLYRHLTPPTIRPYNLPNGNDMSYANFFSDKLAKLFKYKKNGTFIEAGAYDGVAASNTLYLEKTYGWRGLLVECNPMTVPFLRLKNRKSWIADVCLSQTKTPAMVNFSHPVTWGPSAKIGSPVDLTKWGVNTTWTEFQVPAMPLFALLAATNLTNIDFFSLDVEGAEIDVLRTIPWDKVNITAILLEVNHFTSEEQLDIKLFLGSKGYRKDQDYDSDQLFIHSSFQEDRKGK